ncbi:MAG: peptidylprolyl isomerase [Planctomycetes bacterium]|nr:peptidylprolyl isomerase [Planctomycetota bacterium]MCB9918458.1 peptidylprolyl isomerase [Planctomycetota bacterium]
MACALSLAARAHAQEQAEAPETQNRTPKLDPSGTFFEPPIAISGKPLARAKGLSIDLVEYQRFLVARADRAFLEEFVFLRVVAEECRRRGLARTAPQIARANALRRIAEFGPGEDGRMRRRAFENSELQRLRVDALVRATRRIEDRDLRLAFDTQYGLGGVRVDVRHLLVSFVATERRLIAEGNAKPTPDQIADRARRDVQRLREAVSAGTRFEALAPRSDDPGTTTRTKDPRTRDAATVIEGYAYQRFGPEFAEAVRAQPVGIVSEPVRTSHGYHLIEVTSRVVTRFDDVEAELRAALKVAPATPRETQALQDELFEQYGIELH